MGHEEHVRMPITMWAATSNAQQLKGSRKSMGLPASNLLPATLAAKERHSANALVGVRHV